MILKSEKARFLFPVATLAFLSVSLVVQAAEMESRLVAIYEADAVGLSGHHYELFYNADINEDGLLLFHGRTRATSNEVREAIWKEIAPGQVVLVGSNGPESPAAGFEFDKPVEALWQTSETIHAQWPNNPGDVSSDAIWRFEYTPGAETEQRLVHEGDAGPVVGTTLGPISLADSNTSEYLAMRSNARKDVAFVGTLIENNTQLSTVALFFKPANGAIELVAREGDAASGGGQFANVFDETTRIFRLAPDGS